MLVCLSVSEVVCAPDSGFLTADILYLRGDFELLHHPQLKEAADSTLDEFKL